jgi:class 3 adenylate cyclase
MTAASPLLVEALSHRLLRHGGAELWRQVFLGPAFATLRFEVAQFTLLATDAPLAEFSADEAAVLASRVAAEVQPSVTADVLLSFAQPVDALRAAMVLQRLSEGRNIRTSLSTASCTVASFDLGGDRRRVVVGPEIERAEEAVAHAAPGTIVISAETYALLGDRMTDQVHDGLVITEGDEQTVTRASITLAPAASADLSTFAGIGLL